MSDITVDLLGFMGDDLAVVNAARVSFDKESNWEHKNPGDVGWDMGSFDLSGRDKKLIRYLAEHKHRSPFNHSFLSFRVKAPIFVARQLVKHEYLPWNEVSRRYVDSEPEFYIPENVHARPTDKKQGRSKEIVMTMRMTDPGSGDDWTMETVEAMALETESSFHTYKKLIQAGVSPEEARIILPLNTMTEWIWSGSLGAFMKMVNLRDHDHTQYETRLVAKLVAEYIEQEFPVSYRALREFPNV